MEVQLWIQRHIDENKKYNVSANANKKKADKQKQNGG